MKQSARINTRAEQEGVEIIAFALESVRNDALAMVRATAKREKLFGAFISNIAENLGAEDIKAWQKSWKEFVEMAVCTMTESTLTAIDLILDAIVSKYENATEEQRELLNPFCKFFYDISQTEKSQQIKSTETCRNLLNLANVEGSEAFNSHSSIIG